VDGLLGLRLGARLLAFPPFVELCDGDGPIADARRRVARLLGLRRAGQGNQEASRDKNSAHAGMILRSSDTLRLTTASRIQLDSRVGVVLRAVSHSDSPRGGRVVRRGVSRSDKVISCGPLRPSHFWPLPR